MSLATSQSFETAGEISFLESFRRAYESQGFIYVVHPSEEQLPAFMRPYQPHAIAVKNGQGIAIELRMRQNRLSESALTKIRERFDGQTDWKLHVAYMGSDGISSLTIPSSGFALVRTKADDVRWLISQHQAAPAFVMAWSLLEAAARTALKGEAGRPWTPGTVVQTLAAEGYLERELEDRLRPLIEVRNRIVHGELTLEPTAGDIETVLSAIDAVSSAETAPQ